MKVGDTAHEEGFMDGNTTGDDYDYDSNGNLVMDKNKQIAEIEYNHLNLPTYIEHDDYTKGFLRFVYTATGRKIEKAFIKDYLPYVFDHTYYAGNFVYEKTYDPASPDAPAKLRMFFTPEGYVEPVDPDDYSQGFRYVYQYKDHLGNVRLSYSDVDGNGLINGTLFADGFESGGGWSGEDAMYGQGISAYDNTRSHSGGYSGRLDRTNSNTHIYVHCDEWVWIDNAQATQYTFSGWVYSNGPQAQIFFFMNEDGETGYYTQVDHVLTNVKNQWVYVEKTVWVPANIDKLNLRVGLQYGSVGQSVWFDDVKIEMAGANENEILDERNYYPFGLEHKGYNSSVTGVENNYQTYNGKELEKELGLDWTDYGARRYMRELGRWAIIDPLAEGYENWSPYNYAFNNPIYFVDPDGERIIINYGDGRSQEYSYVKDRDYGAIEDNFLKSSLQALDKLYSSGALNIDLNGDGEKTNLFDSLLGDDYDINLVQSKGKGHGYNRFTNEVLFSESFGAVINKSGASKEEMEKTAETGNPTENTGINSPTAQLGHELIHGYNYNTDDKGYLNRRNDYSTSNRNDFSRPHYKNAEEKRTTTLSNQVNTALGEPTRYDHRGIPIKTLSPTSNKLLKVKAND